MGEPRTTAGEFLRNGLLAMGYDEESANEAIVAIEVEAVDVERLLDAIRAYGDARADVAYGRATRRAIDFAWERVLVAGDIPPLGEPRTTFWRAKDEMILDQLRNRPHTDIETVSGRAIFDKAKASRTQELTITAQALRLAIPAIEIEAETKVLRALRGPHG